MILQDGSVEEYGERQYLLNNKNSMFARLLSKDSGGLLEEVLA